MRVSLLVLAVSLAACGAPPGFEEHSCADTGRAVCYAITADNAQNLLDTANTLTGDEAIVLGTGTFALAQQLTLRAYGILLWGQGADNTILDFGAQATQSNGVDAVGDDLDFGFFTILDAKKDGLRIEDSSKVWLHGLKATWTTEQSTDNGAYGLYPVRSSDVLVEGCEASNASDAGIYLGQSEHAVLRNNVAHGNVAGIEIENSQFVDVYGNDAHENTAGLLIFDLPGNPIVGRDVRVFDNVVRDNNTRNFAAQGATVAQVPSGTGTFAMASRRVEIFNNNYGNNDTMDLAVVSGLALTQGDLTPWALQRNALNGADPSDLLILQTSTLVLNFQTSDIFLHGNHFEGRSGDRPDGLNQFGQLFGLVYGVESVDNILYDTIGESRYSATDPAGNSNDNHICVGANTGGTFTSFNLAVVGADPFSYTADDLFRPAAPYTPFDCTSLLTGPIAPVELSFGD